MKRREIEIRIPSAERIDAALSWARQNIARGLDAGPVVLRLGRERRTLDQNAKLWPMLQDIARQVDWYGERLTKEEWKDVMTAGLKRQKVVPGIEGGFVVVGISTRRLPKAEFAELIELIYAFGAEQGVRWTDPKAVDELRGEASQPVERGRAAA